MDEGTFTANSFGERREYRSNPEMQRALVLDANKKPLMPCHPARARKLLKAGRAAVCRRYPFTIILKDRTGGDVQPLTVKIDPGSRVSGIVLVAEHKRGKRTVWAAEIEHRGRLVKARMNTRRMLRRGRRTRKTRYRPPRFLNRKRPKGWLPPSLRSRLENIKTWAARLRQWAPVSGIALELVRFDTQKLENPEISGVEYQQGELFGYEVREYLLEKFGRKCVYCGVESVPLEIEHIVPKSRGGTNQVNNLTISCQVCNQEKGSQTAAEFGYPEVQALAKRPLKDAAAVNMTRWAIWRLLSETGLPVEVGTGGRTKYNRIRQSYPKTHWLDAVCVGQSGEVVYVSPGHVPLIIKATGRGNRRMCATDKYGFPKQHRARQKRAYGFQTGDIVRANKPRGKHAGIHVGRVNIRTKPSFTLKGFHVHPKYCVLIQRSDGYEYMMARNVGDRT